MKRNERKDFFSKKMVRDPQTRQMNWPKMFRKKSLSDELFLHFFCKSSESDRAFNELHDSNSIFPVGGIKSEGVSARMVLATPKRCKDSKELKERLTAWSLKMA